MISYIVTSVRFISLIGFIIANYICYLFFQNSIINIPNYYYLILVLLSFMILKLDIALFFYEKLKSKIPHKKDKSEKETTEKSKSLFQITKSLVKDVFNVKNILILSKIIFFNTLYELFSVYVVWISILGFFHLIDLYQIKLIDASSFFQISALFGLLFGIFQFLLQRHEDKILAKINLNGKRIEQIINQESSFEKFYDSIPLIDSTKTLRRWIHRTTDPKLQMKDFFMLLLEDDETRKYLFKHIEKTPLSVNISYQASNQKFETLDTNAKTNTRRRNDLHIAYRKFFTSEERIDEIIKIVSQEINLNDFRLLALSNINIISESLPQFTNKNFVKVVEELLSEENELDKKIINRESAKEYQQYLHNQVTVKIARKILY